MFYTIVTDEEPFQYSYVRQFTQSIPEGYEFYLELSLSDSGYADITSLSPGRFYPQIVCILYKFLFLFCKINDLIMWYTLCGRRYGI